MPDTYTVGQMIRKLEEFDVDLPIFVEVGGDDRGVFDLDDATNPFVNDGAPYLSIVLISEDD